MVRRSKGAMRGKLMLSVVMAIFMVILTVPDVCHFGGKSGADVQGASICDVVLPVSGLTSPAILTQFNEPPASPCTVVSYAAGNYILPANDYVTFSLANDISFANCPVAQLSVATITFQGTPNVPLFVWLSNSSASTTPVYMTAATQTITKAWFGTGSTSWFGGGPWTKLNVQAIYPSPPPAGNFYPISCTIVYQ